MRCGYFRRLHFIAKYVAAIREVRFPSSHREVIPHIVSIRRSPRSAKWVFHPFVAMMYFHRRAQKLFAAHREVGFPSLRREVVFRNRIDKQVSALREVGLPEVYGEVVAPSRYPEIGHRAARSRRIRYIEK